MSGRERWAFGTAVATAGATFVLLILGNLVHATQSGLACPDWPQCFGTFFPPMVGHVLFEHGHRLFATLVGMLTIVLAALVWRAKPAGHAARSLATGAIGLVIWQGVLGGMTVRMKLPDAVSTAHLATSMAFFSLVLWTVFRTRPATADVKLSRGLQRAIGWTALLVYAQIVLGALVRHTDSGLACTRLVCWTGGWQVALHMAHRVLAFVVAAAVIGVSLATIRAAKENALARLLALVAPGLVVVQIFLGVMSVMTAIEVGTVTAHMATGALLLGTMVSMLLAARAANGAVAGAKPASDGISVLRKEEAAA
jgi:heme A synthase